MCFCTLMKTVNTALLGFYVEGRNFNCDISALKGLFVKKCRTTNFKPKPKSFAFSEDCKPISSLKLHLNKPSSDQPLIYITITCQRKMMDGGPMQYFLTHGNLCSMQNIEDPWLVLPKCRSVCDINSLKTILFRINQ